MLTAKNIYKVYENRNVALKNITVEFPQTGLIAIVGTSGCGKSTLLNVLSNNDNVSKGEIKFCDKLYSEWDCEQLRREFAYIYQDYKLIENLTVYQNIMIGQELACNDINHDGVVAIAEQLGIVQLLDQKVYALSGGQQQRVAIARAMARNPKVVFADEPTGNLDSENSENVFEILKEISEKILVIVVSHDENIVNFADRMIELENGKILNDYIVNSEDKSRIIKYVKEKQQAERQRLEFEAPIHKPKEKKEKDTDNNQTDKPSKIGIKSKFSYTRGKNKNRKAEGLSAKSAVALTIAFNNKGVTKKIILLMLSAIMIMLIFWTSAVIFTNPEAAFCRDMKQKKIPFVTMNIYSKVKFDNEEFAKVHNFIKQETGEDIIEKSSSYLNTYVNNLVPENYDTAPHYADEMNFGYTIYTDDPSDLGLKIIKGRAPKVNKDGIDEIAIPKTIYDYFMQVKRVKNSRNEVIDFDKQPILGSFIKGFNLIITGVFDDLNDYDMSTSEEDWCLRSYNDLCCAILRPTAAKVDYLSFIGSRSSKFKLYYEDFRWPFLGFIPCNDSIRKYYYEVPELQNDLAEDEVYVSDSFARDYFYTYNKELNAGDLLELDLVTERHSMLGSVIDEVIEEKLQFKVKGILQGPEEYASLEGADDIVVNPQLYEKWINASKTPSRSFLIKSKYITPKFINKIRNFIYYDISPEIAEIVKSDWQHENFSVDFYMIKHFGNDEYYNDVIDIARFYIGVPLCVLALIAFGILVSVLMSDMIKEKGKDILILRALGATNKDIWKIFGLLAAVMMVVQFVIGCLLGGAMVYGLNVFWMIVGNYEFYTPTFFISPLSVFVMLFATIAISGGSMWLSTKKLSSKNLRQSFQKQRK